jgi:centromeric protein E
MASPTRSKESLRRPNPKISSANLAARYSRDSGVGFMPTSAIGNGDYLSPPQSRSSSAQDSYSTSATTVDASPIISGDEARGRTDNREGGGEKESKGNVIISVRVRPDGPEDQMSPDWLVDGRRGRMVYRGKDGGTYEYDNVFTQSDNNARVYESCAKRLVRRVMEGYHGTVFAYGMTGTGKTFSMQGTTSSPGVIPLAITDIFSFIRETPHREFLLRVSYLEIYNEQIHDLLATEPGTKAFVPLDQQTKGEEIKLREDPKRGVYATPLKEEIVQSPTQLLRVIARGDLARRTGSTQFNARSSRSHAVVQIVVESRDRIAGASAGNMADNRRAGISGGVRVSTLSLIDLAGSERAAESKERRTEGAHINRSLLTLGTVIARLSKDGKDKNGNHLPYRDSKLTRLLQPALSGGSLISILCTIAVPMGSTVVNNITNIGETVNTLKFAARAKNNIISHAKKGEESFAGAGVDAGSKALLDRYRAEVAELRRELETQRKKEDDDVKERESREEREMERVRLTVLLHRILADSHLARRTTTGNATCPHCFKRTDRTFEPTYPVFEILGGKLGALEHAGGAADFVREVFYYYALD